MKIQIFYLFSFLNIFIGLGQVTVTAFSETFENATHQMTFVNGSQTNKWYKGTTTSGYCNGTQGMNISNNGTAYAYTVTATSVVHSYFDIAIPANATSITLQYNCKVNGQNNADDIRVWSCVNTFTPTAGTQISASGTNRVLLATHQGVSTCTAQSLTISSVAGTTRRIIFQWRNDNSSGSGSGTIDNITLTYVQPCSNPTGGGTVAGNQTICSGGDPVAFTSSTGASTFEGTLEYKWQYSSVSDFSSGVFDIGSTNSTTYDPPTGLTSTRYYRRLARVNCKTDWVGAAASNTLTVTAVADANAPSATKSPNTSSVCIDKTLTLTSPTYGSQPGQSCGFEYRFSTNNSSTWSSISSSIPSFAAVVGTNVIQIRTVGGCSSGCDASAWTSYSWTVVADPVITNQSSTYEIGEGETAQLVSSATGGTGTLVYGWRYSVDNIGFADVVNGTPTNSSYSFDANLATDNALTIGGLGQGTYYYRFRQTNNDLQCAAVGTTITLTVNPLPLPVELLYLKSMTWPLFNSVQWATASEHNSSYFDLLASHDGVGWESIAKIPSAGYSTQFLQYSFVDWNQTELTYYKLVQYDINGDFKEYGPISASKLVANKKIIRYNNILGQDVDPAKFSGLLIVVYEDGSIKKIIR
jgi:hypothetical protein